MSKDTSGPFHPWSGSPGPGITIRTWLAGMAMQGILAADTDEAVPVAMAADWAFEVADAMLARVEE